MKKMKKSIFIMILVAINMLVCVMPVAALSSSVTIDGFAYSINLSDGIVTIEECKQSYSKLAVEIPATITTSYGELPVLVVGSSFLRKNCKHESVKIPEYVALIDLTSFYNCKSLKSIIVDENNLDYSSDEYGVLFNKEKTELIYCPRDMQCEHYMIPDSVTSIGESAFEGCTGVKAITIPDSVTTIGDSAFSECTGLININWNVKNIIDSDSLFYLAGIDGDGINVVFGDNVESIPTGMFYDSKLKSVTIGSSVKTIGDHAFVSCFGFNSIELPDSLEIIEDYAFSGCSDLETVSIGNSVKTINYRAFSGCTSLKNIIIPESTTYIAQDAFYNTSLEKIVINNPKCVIEYGASTLPVDVVIYGYANSPAQMYAQMYGRDFVPLSAGECEHTYSEWIIDADATCTQRGFSHRVCTLCNGIEFEIIDETGHTDADGDEVCDVCDSVLSVQTPDTDNDNDTGDSSSSGITEFFNSIVEMFNKIIAWIKSLFGMA